MNAPRLLPLSISARYCCLMTGLTAIAVCGCGPHSNPATSEAYSAPAAATPINVTPVKTSNSGNVAPPRTHRRISRSARMAAPVMLLAAADPVPAVQTPSPSTATEAAKSAPSDDTQGQKEATTKSATPPARSGPRYVKRSQHDPNGIGKFYMGREIAHVMGATAASWLERPEREQEESLTKLVAALKLKPGMVVADVGAGSGVITLMLSEKVGPEGRVVAIDIQQEMLNLLARKLKVKKIDNVVLVKGTDRSAKLKPETIDLALMVDVYHEFAFPYEMLENISQSLKPGGRVVFVEYRREDPAVLIKLVHKMTEAQVRLEAELPEFKLKWKETIATLPLQHIIVFERLAAKEGISSSSAKSPS